MKKLLSIFLLLFSLTVKAQISNTWLIGQDEQIQWDTTTVVRTPSLTSYLLKADTTALLANYALEDGNNATGTWPISIIGSAPTLTTGRTIGTITGDATSAGSSFNGSANNTNALTLATVNGDVGTFGSATKAGIFTVNAKGLITAASSSTVTPAVGSITGLGTGVAAALAINVGTAGSPVLNGGALGTPSSGTGTNLTGIPQSGVTSLVSDLALKAPLASPSFTTPTLGVATATSLNTGTTLNGTIFAKSTNAVTLASSNHGLTVGGESNDHNLAIGEYGTGLGLQARNNGASGALNLNALGGDVRFGIDAPAGVFNITGFHKGSGTGDYCNFELRNGAGTSAVDALFMRIMGTAWTTSGMMIQDAGVIGTGTNISGGLSIGTQASADVRFYTNNTLRWTLDNAGDLLATGKLRSNGGGVGYATGAGGTVTQITSRTTGVTLNKLCGNITMFSAAQAANALVTFTLTNSFIEAGDYLLVQHISATNGGAWVFSTVCGAGSATINIRNQTTASITEATPLRFFILKATTN